MICKCQPLKKLLARKKHLECQDQMSSGKTSSEAAGASSSTRKRIFLIMNSMIGTQKGKQIKSFR